MHQELLARGEAVHEKTVAKVMREAGIQAKSQRIDRRLVVDVLEMAVSRELPDAGLVAHSDRGVQYASEHFQGVLTQHDLECSMSPRPARIVG